MKNGDSRIEWSAADAGDGEEGDLVPDESRPLLIGDGIDWSKEAAPHPMPVPDRQPIQGGLAWDEADPELVVDDAEDPEPFEPAPEQRFDALVVDDAVPSIAEEVPVDAVAPSIAETVPVDAGAPPSAEADPLPSDESLSAVADEPLWPSDDAEPLEEWQAWRGQLTGRLSRTASVLRDFAEWASDTGLRGLDTSAITSRAAVLEGSVRRLDGPDTWRAYPPGSGGDAPEPAG